uniref:Uncharacterized protein AlNc14C3G464 n=1 Tax=Albugo laibachii Nc14 TaxID=890382 RepID=F0VZY6_9STRA|nr:conserved hypothetical protein [Albugo laibachii Nc14]|eukprot:CCA14357.1 conserved hypothetical protein [Albugo laibachii Nc14]
MDVFIAQPQVFPSSPSALVKSHRAPPSAPPKRPPPPPPNPSSQIQKEAAYQTLNVTPMCSKGITSPVSASSSCSVDSSPSQSFTIKAANVEEDFPQLQSLSQEKRNLLTRFIDESVQDAYELSQGLGRIQWYATKTREGVSICHAKADANLTIDAAVRSKCNLMASVDEILDLLTTESTEEFAGLEMIMNPQEFLDGQVLYTLHPRDRSHRNKFRYACVKWHCLKTLAPAVTTHRDYLYVELVDQFVDPVTGALVGFRLSKSIELNEIPVDDTAHIFVRARTMMLTTATAKIIAPAKGEKHTLSSSVELSSMVINDLGERLPTWLVNKMVDSAALRSARLRDHLNQKKMDVFVFIRSSDMVPFCKRVCCIICTKSFSFIRKKYNCVACGDVVCNQCSIHQLIVPQQYTEHIGKRKARICIQCSSKIGSKKKESEFSTCSSSVLADEGGKADARNHDSCGSYMSRNSSASAHYSNGIFDRNSCHVRTGGEEDSRPSWLSVGTTTTLSMDSNASMDDRVSRFCTVRDSITAPLSLTTSMDEVGKLDPQRPTEVHKQPRKVEIDLGIGRYKTKLMRTQSELIPPSHDNTETKNMERHSERYVRNRSLPSREFLSEAVNIDVPTIEIEEIAPDIVMKKTMRVNLQHSKPKEVSDPVIKMPHRTSIRPQRAHAPEAQLQRPKRGPPARPSAPPPIKPQLQSLSFAPETPRSSCVDFENDTAAIANLQIHLNRMTEISQSLRELNVFDKRLLQTRASTANAFATLSKMEGMQHGVDPRSITILTEPLPAAMFQEGACSSPSSLQGGASPTSASYFVDGDKTFYGFLPDSAFVESLEVGELADGWKAVHSKTTGKVYFYNESHGTTSWTMPDAEPQTEDIDAAYLIL